MKNKWIVAGWLAATLALASCSKDPVGAPVDLSSPIALSGSVVSGAVSADAGSAEGSAASAATRASIDGDKFPALSPAFRVLALSAESEDATTTTHYFSEAVNSAADGELSWADGQKYFPAGSALGLKFYAWGPASLTQGAPEDTAVGVTIDGSQDVVWASAFSYPTTDDVPLQFRHLLMKHTIRVVRDASFPAGKRITSLKIGGQTTKFTLNLLTGALSVQSPMDVFRDTVTPYSDATGKEITATATDLCSVMLSPDQYMTPLSCEIVADGVTYSDVPLTIDNSSEAYKAGVNHVVTLTFKLREITASARIAPWEEPDDYPCVRAQSEGAYVVSYDENGAMDPALFEQWPMHSIWRSATPEHSESAPEENDSGYNTVSTSFYIYEGLASAGVTLSIAESACNARQDDGTVGRLPTAQEIRFLQENGLVDQLPEKLKNRLTSGVFWTATGYSGASSQYFVFSKGESAAVAETASSLDGVAFTVLCVRDVTNDILQDRTVPFSVGADGRTIRFIGLSSLASDYAVHPAWTMTPEHAETSATNNSSGMNGVSSEFTLGKKQFDLGEDELTYAEVAAMCAGYTEDPDGFDQGLWRVPTIRELDVIYQLRTQLYEGTGFNKGNFNGSFTLVSSTANASDAGKYWSLDWGNITGDYGLSSGKTFCVRDRAEIGMKWGSGIVFWIDPADDTRFLAVHSKKVGRYNSGTGGASPSIPSGYNYNDGWAAAQQLKAHSEAQADSWMNGTFSHDYPFWNYCYPDTADGNAEGIWFIPGFKQAEKLYNVGVLPEFSFARVRMATARFDSIHDFLYPGGLYVDIYTSTTYSVNKYCIRQSAPSVGID